MDDFPQIGDLIAFSARSGAGEPHLATHTITTDDMAVGRVEMQAGDVRAYIDVSTPARAGTIVPHPDSAGFHWTGLVRFVRDAAPVS